ncbi:MULTISPECIES: acyl-CoA dehydrogenase family protein [unclassified Streptomyces]|uniref:acyl-CoA dehydrogenase family protein n=1 Tax=unclassified Streptomyces TaxID=2593676 RepID=UPI0006FAF9DF|nr:MULTISPECIES: acyl-CoA dehydrogenase family protein [unclassified Streptomyces]KQX53428.1 acyl-CoA dehydrogenase [Streptomyces sp. Root1304]KRA90346.1 acyl-CoA dehydrogenase [Streptomyces sp. Root66D1]
MAFLPTDEQRAFARSLDAMLTAADTPATVRAWAGGDPAPGRALWGRLAEAGVFALAVPEAYEGVGPLPVELAHALVESGRHAVPGPLAETVASAVLLGELAALGEPGPAKRLLPGLASGERTATLAMTGPGTETGRNVVPYALDADRADAVLVVRGEELWQAPGHGPVRVSADPARRLARPAPGGELLAEGPAVAVAAAHARRWAMLATASQSLGVGLALLDRTVAYARQRTQFGTPIGAFQAVKHRLADTLLALEFARPLLFGAAVALAAGDDADVREAEGALAAAKVATGEAGYTAARTALQIHGAVGYTEELDLSLWLRRARPLRDAWGNPAECRAAVLDAYA